MPLYLFRYFSFDHTVESILSLDINWNYNYQLKKEIATLLSRVRNIWYKEEEEKNENTEEIKIENTTSHTAEVSSWAKNKYPHVQDLQKN